MVFSQDPDPCIQWTLLAAPVLRTLTVALNAVSRGRFLCMGLASLPTREAGCGGEAEARLSLGSIGGLFRDHPADCWPSASQAPGNSVSVPEGS